MVPKPLTLIKDLDFWASAARHSPKKILLLSSMTESGANLYDDNWIDRLFIRLFSRKMAIALGQNSPLSGYDGFVDLSRRIMQGRSAQEQQVLVGVILRSLIPPPILWAIRSLVVPTRRICEWNAWFASVLFEWLVGPCDWIEADVVDAHGNVQRQKSRVHIQKCRYLEQSGCVGMCVNMCKLPTQSFFCHDFGIPVQLTPNFEDFSCEMTFGQVPAPLETEEAYHQPCLTEHCETARISVEPCPKISR
jgi:hypothetical protein